MTRSVPSGARQRELADRLKASGALDGIFEQINAGEVPLGGLFKGLLKATLSPDLEMPEPLPSAVTRSSTAR
jgi:hypothetical protein